MARIKPNENVKSNEPRRSQQRSEGVQPVLNKIAGKYDCCRCLRCLWPCGQEERTQHSQISLSCAPGQDKTSFLYKMKCHVHKCMCTPFVAAQQIQPARALMRHQTRGQIEPREYDTRGSFTLAALAAWRALHRNGDECPSSSAARIQTERSANNAEGNQIRRTSVHTLALSPRFVRVADACREPAQAAP